MSFQIEFIGLEEFTALMRKGPEIVKQEMITGVNRLTLQGQAVAQQKVGVDTGNLRRSITTEKATYGGGTVRGAWGTNVPYARPHETGRGAGKQPPISAMQAWAGRHGVNAYLIARAIGRRGTKGKWYMRDSKTALEPKVQAEFRAIAMRIIAKMGGG